MRCPRCGRSMMFLLVSAICDSCDGPPKGTFYRGFVVWRDPRKDQPASDYVFRTAHDAVTWRSLMDLEGLEVRTVLSDRPIPWRVAAGKAAGLVCADKLFEVYRDHRFAPAPYRAFLAPPNFYVYKECVQLSA